MGTMKNLSNDEKLTIKILNGLKVSTNKIAECLNRHRSTIQKYLGNKTHCKPKNQGRKRIINDRTIRQMKRLVNNMPVTCSYIKKVLRIKASKETIRRTLKQNEINWKKCEKSLPLNKNHKDKRLMFCENEIIKHRNWNNVIFSDKKGFTMDGLVNKAYSWSQKNKSHKIVTRHSCGGSIMVWGAISTCKKFQLHIIDGSLTSQKYINIQHQHVLPNLTENDIYQQDNHPVHTAKVVKEVIETNNITVLDWSAISPDLNIIENVWAKMADEVYGNCKQYFCKDQLRNAIIKAWTNIEDVFMWKTCVNLFQKDSLIV